MVFLLFHLTCYCLKLKHLSVPGAVQNGSAIWLNCAYETENDDTLYTVKWYKYNVEFYRYIIPDSDHKKAQRKFYPQAGLYIEVSRACNSKESQLSLNNNKFQ